MPPATLNITRGVNHKPAASEALKSQLDAAPGLAGECFFGYPLVATPEGRYSVDATLISPSKGIVLFDLVEGTTLGDYKQRQDDIGNKIEARLRLHRELMIGRKLAVPLYVITYAPGIANLPEDDPSYPLVNDANLIDALAEPRWDGGTDESYRSALSAIESLSSIRKSRSKREAVKANSRGARLKALEDSIATLDHRQNRAVLETVEGVQRIRGLAGSGKTIVLALKAAYLHTQFPSWRIAVTFNTRSLKAQFRKLITAFCLEQSGEEPDWTKIRVVNAWGAPGGEERDGIYYEFCRATGHEFLDFKNATSRFGSGKAFDGAVQLALGALQQASPNVELYDTILVDEAQDFSPSFLQLCFHMLRDPKRLVYAYDELQNLSGTSVQPPEQIFGLGSDGQPRVSLVGDQRRDVILQKCYRNSRPVLVAAHALGFGVYRPTPAGSATGLVQMFDQPALWEEIGYRVYSGELAKGKPVSLERSEETSPPFLEQVSNTLDDLVEFREFPDEPAQRAWLIEEIKKNLNEDELRHDDIIVVHPDPLTARERMGPVRRTLFEAGIQTHLAGVDTSADVFFRPESQSITFTGIFRAKGNEAGMVYVVNAQDCDGAGVGLATLRNRLFTAITRSKAWVRVLGYGPKMKALKEEFEKLKAHSLRLDFVYPDDAVLSKLRVVHRDLSPHERQRLERKKDQATDLVAALENGEISAEDLDGDTRNKLLKLLSGDK